MVLPDISMTNYREAIIALTAHHRVPAVYPLRYFAASGDVLRHRRGRGVFARGRLCQPHPQPGDLPVQAPTKYELVINLKTAKALGLTVPTTLLVSADEMTLVGGAAVGWPLAAECSKSSRCNRLFIARGITSAAGG